MKIKLSDAVSSPLLPIAAKVLLLICAFGCHTTLRMSANAEGDQTGVTGRIKPPNLQPAPVIVLAKLGGDVYADVYRLQADPQSGSFQKAGIPAGAYRLIVRAQGRVPVVVEPIEVKQGQTVDIGEVALKGAGTVTGRVKPPPRTAKIGVVDPTTYRIPGYVPVDPRTGQFHIEALPPGEYGVYLCLDPEEKERLWVMPHPTSNVRGLSASDITAVDRAVKLVIQFGYHRMYDAVISLFSRSYQDPHGLTYEDIRSMYLKIKKRDDERKAASPPGGIPLPSRKVPDRPTISRLWLAGDRQQAKGLWYVHYPPERIGEASNVFWFTFRHEGDKVWRILSERNVLENARLVFDDKLGAVQVVAGKETVLNIDLAALLPKASSKKG